MNTKPICIASAAATFLAACGLEGGGLSVGQAIAVLMPASVLLIWSYMLTNWYEPAGGNKEDGR